MQPLNLSFDALAADYAAGRATPADVVDAILARADALEDYNIWITRLTREQIQPYLDALAERDPADCPLYGLPFAIKDNIDLAGVPTTAGCPEYRYVPGENAFVVERLIAAGAIPIGKTNLDQFATGLVGTRSPYGATANAFDRRMISGGSSAGSAVAVAMGLASFSLGTDTAGSGRVPAAFNNLIGVKPTRGRLSSRGMVPACRSLDCTSIFALTAADAARVLDVAGVYDPADSYARAVEPSPRAPRAAFTFGVPAADQLDFAGDELARAQFEAAVARLEDIGGRPVTIDFSAFARAAVLLYEGPWVAERYAAIRAFIEAQPEALLDVTRRIIEPAGDITAVSAFEAAYELEALRRKAEAVLRTVDCVVTPTAPCFYSQAEVAADPIATNSRLGVYTNFMNLMDLAAVAVPTAFRSDGLPGGVTLFADAFTDATLLDYAARLGAALQLPLGATTHRAAAPASANDDPLALPDGWMALAVCGAHLDGMPLNHQLTERGGFLLEATQSAPAYRLYALAGGPPYKPGMIRDEAGGAAIDVEVWALPTATVGSFLAAIPAPLGLGKIELADGRMVTGFICENRGVADAEDITALGGWRAYMARAAG